MVKGMTSLAALSICLPLLWFYTGPGWASGFVAVIVLAVAWRQPFLAMLVVIFAAILLLRLDYEARFVLPAHWQHDTAELTVCLSQPARVFEDYQSAVGTVTDQPNALKLRRLRFTADTGRVLKAGDCIQGDFRLRKPVGNLVPGQFNATRYYFSERIDALGSLQELHQVSQQPGVPVRLHNRAEPYFQQSDAHAIWSALSLGWSSSLPVSLGDLFEQTQLKHLMVVSGMHVGMVAAWGLILGRVLLQLPGIPLNRVFHLQLVWVALLCGAFVSLTGFGFPAVRAWVMLAIPLIALSVGRRFNALDVLACAAVAITLFRPQAWLSTGAWLSFLLVAIIVRLAQRWSQRDHSTVWLAFKLQATLTLLMIPITAAMGFIWHPLSLLINALMIPLVTLLLLPWSLLILLLPDLAWVSGYEWTIALALRALEQVSPLHQTAPAWTWWQILLVTVLLWWLLSQSVERPVRWLAAPLIPVVALVLGSSKPGVDAFQMTLLDVGHGQAMVLQWPDQTWLYDLAGQWQDGRSVAQQRLAPWYRRESIDPGGLLVSHADTDHAGGAHWAVREWPKAIRVTGGPRRLATMSGRSGWRNCHRPEQGQGAFPFELIPVPSALQTSSNDTSCVMWIPTSAGAVLITGDASRTVEYWLLQARPELFPAAAIVVGHHGSHTSSATAFLDASPDALLLVSSGDRHMPRWPNPDLVAYTERHGRVLHNTADRGTFTLKVDEGRMHLADYRSAYRKRWLK
ncbi:DNA internalization-related competence protein ComEC/Rec2 [Saccharospirillum impatiens]|uniref:DNA internalization-related competence protein ComEC/Rec2 n=1 Tax=Saccharospirillum impatiens TaxID=169438 RepID=UPI00040DC1F7|nr:DNA internalization-related competence protein ComEC/Rec2 [Saccharospirillum impatiens]